MRDWMWRCWRYWCPPQWRYRQAAASFSLNGTPYQQPFTKDKPTRAHSARVSTGVAMSRRQVYRTNAAECIRLADIVKSPEVRTILITMAHGWYRLAED